MNLVERQQYYNLIKEARGKYAQQAEHFRETTEIFDKLLEKINLDLEYDKSTLEATSNLMCEKLQSQNIELRKNFVELNKFNDIDLENLCGVLGNEVNFDTPTLELFPGTGQFLPFVVGSEPLYIADRFMEINDIAAKSLNNDFYVTRRLRKYKIKPFDLWTLPQNSFGLVYCFNEFFFADANYILLYSEQILNLLYSGGKFIFNFLPNDQEWSINQNSLIRFSVIDYEKLIQKLIEQGWELVNYKLQPVKSSYIIVRKPGEKTPRLKLTGAVAEIIDLPPSDIVE